MKPRFSIALLALSIGWVASFFTSVATAQNYAVDWHQVSGGGTTSAGGGYKLTGTIGQHDAAPPLSGWNYSLTGGFWALYAVPAFGAPMLNITSSGNHAVISWPVVASNYVLQANATPATTGWANTGGVLFTNSGTVSLTLTPASTKLFFRLRSP